ncbi:hypothetical protein EMIHUDRAFT_233111 [Emiliania huxleyi CCMP1516]|uniref:Uncharacterized protein n=2 Tax=Emiliania huxleyi TaxID=2903 RepID=A0A0D3K3E4_EMIH1|nr:hypothetical protein EMIHUDRAFT_233111 [Emiliania huxleyi CCMP1516]EOD30279.1 hypothetical protein EMIHUDRAFT_233111 [Emiliania huxleyi CCMP1516]|eukprot:XP_005782708.1 hypothetical protein EMIHUDRAFT_233111 [Emiliania huxleyi CCMP1516]
MLYDGFSQLRQRPGKRGGRLHAKGYTLAHHLQSGSPGRSAHGGGTPGPGQPAVTRLSA